MNSSITWVARPLPLVYESLMSFLSRWACANSLPSRRDLLNMLDVSPAIRITADEVIKIAAKLGLSHEVLLCMAPVDDPKLPALRRSNTRTRHDAVCPHCLAESSHSRFLWGHALATACPDHGNRLLCLCQSCQQILATDRPYAHMCQCGADLRRQSVADAPGKEVELAYLLMGIRPPNLSLPLKLDDSVPVDIDMFVLGFSKNFCDLNAGKPHVRTAKASPPATMPKAIELVTAAFQMMENWPINFEVRLDKLKSDRVSVVSSGIAARIGPAHRFLFKRHNDPAYILMQKAMANWLVRTHDGTINGRNNNIVAIANEPVAFHPVSVAARLLGVNAERIHTGIDLSQIQATDRDEGCGNRRRYLSREEIDRLISLQSEFVGESSARSTLCVSKTIFEFIKEADWLTHCDPMSLSTITSGTIDNFALHKLMGKLITSAPKRNGAAEGFVYLRDLNLKRTTDRQRLVSLFRAIGSGSMAPVGHDETSGVGGLMFNQSDVDVRIASWFVTRGLTLQQISNLTSAHYDAVKSWVDDGLLRASREPLEHGAPWVVDLKDLITFLQTYSPLAWQATAIDSTTRGLTTRLERIGVPPVMPKSGRGSLAKLPELFKALETIRLS